MSVCPVARPIASARSPWATARSSRSLSNSAAARFAAESRQSCELDVRERIDDAGRLRAMLALPPPSPRRGRSRARARPSRVRAAPGRRAAWRRHGSPGPLAHRLALHAVVAADRELDHERRRLLGTWGRRVRPARSPAARGPARGGRAGARRPRRPSSAARASRPTRRARARWPRAGPSGSRRTGRSRPVSARAPATAPTRSSAGAPSDSEAQRACEPPRGGRRRMLRGRLAGLSKNRDRGRVALPRGALHVMRARHRRRTASGERAGAPLVRTEPPAAAASTRTPPGEASGCRNRNLRGTSVARTRSKRSSSSRASMRDASGVAAAAAANSGSNGSPATAAPSSTRRADSDRSASSSLSAAATSARNVGAGQMVPPGRARPGRSDARSGRAARGRTDCRRSRGRARPLRPRRRIAEQLGASARVRAASSSAHERPAAVRPRQRRGQPLRHLAGAQRECHQNRRCRRSPQQRPEQLRRTPGRPSARRRARERAALPSARSSSSLRTARWLR